ncbi:MAG: DNA polymerase III subunit delta [Alphaproteobacteria bacterium]|nr:DNA polymerase III subunit delta [Alphaproteobacteria bacterium]
MRQSGDKALAFCERPPEIPRIALIFGPDAGFVSAAADSLARAWLPVADPINLVRLSDDDFKRDPLVLVDELVARSLLGGDRLVRLRTDREPTAKILVGLLADIGARTLMPEAALIIEGGDLGKTSKLRTAVEASADAIALQLFADDEAGVAEFVRSRLSAAQAPIEPDALSAFAAELTGDRRLAMAETDKLELYALDLGRPLTLLDIGLVASGEQPLGADDAADAAISGDALSAAQSINRFLDAGGSAISALRTLHFRLLRLSDAQASGAGSGSRLRPPVFDKQWPAYSRAIRSWSTAALQQAFTALYEAEKACKRAGAPAEAIARTTIDRIARRAP